MLDRTVTAIKNQCARSGLLESLFFNKYHYMFSPAQIKMLLELTFETKDVEGSYVEVGCAFGATTVLLKKYMDELGLKRPCYALDTFSGFVDSHAEHDIRVLGKNPDLKKAFRRNSVEWLRATLRVGRVSGVEIVKGDATKFDFDSIPKIAFALLDVDLYEPIANILPKLYDKLAPGGIVVVDDCEPGDKWEGALVAYKEYMASRGQEPNIVSGKLGLVRKDRAEAD